MSRKIQVTLNDTLYEEIARQASATGLSVSSLARYLLKMASEQKKTNKTELEKIMLEDEENITLDAFNARIDKLINA